MQPTRDLRLFCLVLSTPEEKISALLSDPQSEALRTAMTLNGTLDTLTAPKDALAKAVQRILVPYQDQMTRYRDICMSVSPGIDAVLQEIYKTLDGSNPAKIVPVPVAVKAIVGEGDKDLAADNDFNLMSSVINLIDLCDESIRDTLICIEQPESSPPLRLTDNVDRVIYVSALLKALDTYLGCIDDFQQLDVDATTMCFDDDPLPEDGSVEIEHVLTLLAGMEQFINGTGGTDFTYEQRYLTSVLQSNGVISQYRAGNEGAITDGIKNAAKEVYRVIKETLISIKDSIFNKTDDEIVTDVEKSVEENKKALAAIEDQDAEIKDAAKEGLVKLCDSVDETGELAQEAQSVDKVKDAPGFLDKVLRFCKGEYAVGKKIKELFTTAEKECANVEKAANAVSAVSEDNKDGVKAAKAEVTQATAASREALKNAQKGQAKHSKRMNAAKKMAAGMSPAVFSNTPSNKQPPKPRNKK